MINIGLLGFCFFFSPRPTKNILMRRRWPLIYRSRISVKSLEFEHAQMSSDISLRTSLLQSENAMLAVVTDLSSRKDRNSPDFDECTMLSNGTIKMINRWRRTASVCAEGLRHISQEIAEEDGKFKEAETELSTKEQQLEYLWNDSKSIQQAITLLEFQLGPNTKAEFGGASFKGVMKWTPIFIFIYFIYITSNDWGDDIISMTLHASAVCPPS